MKQPQLYVDNSFLNIFDKLIEKDIIETCNINLFSIKIRNNAFDYDALVDQLVDRLVTFCTCSKQYQELISTNKSGTLSKNSRKLFREYIKVKKAGREYTENDTTDGEVGELMLYSFLESHLNAPKILTKMRFKTSTNDPVKRADGIHLLKIEEGYFQLIYGESKLYKDLTSGITDAFKSVHEFKTRNNNNIHDECIFLINNIESELTTKEYEYVKAILIPNESEKEYDVSFGIFIGFEIEVPEEFANKNNREFRIELKKLLKEKVSEKIQHIKNKINEFDIRSNNCYIYLVPFTDLNKDKLKILEAILE